MEKQEFLKVIQAILLLFDGMSEEEVCKVIDKSSNSKASYIVNFLKSYK